MNLDLDEAVKKQVTAVIAQEIIGKLSTDSREQLLAKGVTELLDNYTFRRSVEKLVEDAAKEAAGTLLQTPEWQERILRCVRVALCRLESLLPAAVEKALAECFFGCDGDAYSRSPSPIRKYLNLDNEQKKA
jgi:hypothetical protein